MIFTPTPQRMCSRMSTMTLLPELIGAPAIHALAKSILANVVLLPAASPQKAFPSTNLASYRQPKTYWINSTTLWEGMMPEGSISRRISICSRSTQ